MIGRFMKEMNKQLQKLIDEIKEYQTKLCKATGYTKIDLSKYIHKMLKDLKEYCYYKKLNFKKICEENQI
jgi:two-component sensor histidine kinase